MKRLILIIWFTLMLGWCMWVSAVPRSQNTINTNTNWNIQTGWIIDSWTENVQATWSLSWCDLYHPSYTFFNSLENALKFNEQQINTWIVSLSWFIFKTQKYKYFDIDVPEFSGMINWYSLSRSDINTWVWNLEMIHHLKQDMWIWFSISLENIYIDNTKTENRFDPIEKYIWWNKYDCIYSTTYYGDPELRKIYYKYWPQMCWDDRPCKWWSDISMFAIHPISETENLVIKVYNGNSIDAKYQILLDRMFSSIHFKK